METLSAEDAHDLVFSDVTIHWEHQLEIHKMAALNKTEACVVPEPSNPWDANAHKVIVRHNGLAYKMGCLRKGHAKEFPPGTYACFFKRGIDRFGNNRLQCILQRKVETSAADLN